MTVEELRAAKRKYDELVGQREKLRAELEEARRQENAAIDNRYRMSQKLRDHDDSIGQAKHAYKTAETLFINATLAGPE